MRRTCSARQPLSLVERVGGRLRAAFGGALLLVELQLVHLLHALVLPELGLDSEWPMLSRSGRTDDGLSVQVPSRVAQSAVMDHKRLQSPGFDGNWDELGELPNDASRELREAIGASLESYDEEEARRAAREAKFEAQEQSDLISASGASLYEGKRERELRRPQLRHIGQPNLPS